MVAVILLTRPEDSIVLPRCGSVSFKTTFFLLTFFIAFSHALPGPGLVLTLLKRHGGFMNSVQCSSSLLSATYFQQACCPDHVAVPLLTDPANVCLCCSLPTAFIPPKVHRQAIDPFFDESLLLVVTICQLIILQNELFLSFSTSLSIH